MSDAVLRADAFALPFRDGIFDVVVADPPYEGKNRGKKGVGYVATGYVPFRGRDWWQEAWRTLAPSGALYIFCAVKELPAWLETVGARTPLVDVLAWIAPNHPGLSAYWRRGTGGRAPAWRPILHWQKPPLASLSWEGLVGPRVHALTAKALREDGGRFVDPNAFFTAAIQSNMHEALPWPNQLPVALLTWLLRPHRGARVLDLFTGTGTTREAAISLGLEVFSVDLSPQAVDLVRRRPAQMALVAPARAPRDRENHDQLRLAPPPPQGVEEFHL